MLQNVLGQAVAGLRRLAGPASALTVAVLLAGCGAGVVESAVSTGTSGTGTTGTGTTGTGSTGTGSTGTGTGTTGTGSTGTGSTGTGSTGTGSTGTGSNTPTGPGPGQAGNYTGPAFTVTVKAGTAPLVGAEVQLYAAGTTGNGAGATSLLTQAAVTGTNGVATIATGYTCPLSSSMVYLISMGGAIGTGSANSNIWLMTAIGSCGSLTSGASLVVDEATTVAAAYALAPFYVSYGYVGSSATNTVGLANAFATAASMGDPVTGTSPGSTLPSNAVSPAARVNSLANLLNTCVVSASACSGLYADTSTNGVPVDTLDAMVSLAQNPTANVAALYTLATTGKAYSPVLAAQPTDWSMFINFSGGGMSLPTGMGVDSQGNVWVANYNNVASKFSPIGAPVFPNGVTGAGLDQSYGLALDLNDNVWIPNETPFYGAGASGGITELNSSGKSLAGTTGFTGSGLYYPTSVAIDPNGTVWAADNGDARVSLLSSSGVSLSGSSGYVSSMFAFPVVVVVDGNHYGWVGNLGSNFVTKVSPDGSSITDYTAGYGASGLAIDQNDNIWTANFYDSSVSQLKNSGSSVGTYTASGSIAEPQGIAVDGIGNVWVANYRAAYLTELAGSGATTPGTALTPAAGVGGDAKLLEAYALVIDASGNLWVTDYGTNMLTKFVGMASPVKTPLSGLPKAP